MRRVLVKSSFTAALLGQFGARSRQTLIESAPAGDLNIRAPAVFGAAPASRRRTCAVRPRIKVHARSNCRPAGGFIIEGRFGSSQLPSVPVIVATGHPKLCA